MEPVRDGTPVVEAASFGDWRWRRGAASGDDSPR